jgi:membrane protease subunit HflC
MSNKLLTRLFVVMVIVVIGIFMLDSSFYSVGPGAVVVEINHGQATVATRKPGLHWKRVNAEVVSLDARVQVTYGTFDADTRNPKSAGSAGYALMWRLSHPRKYYNATQGKGSVALDRMEGAVDVTLRKLLAKPSSRTVFSVLPATVHSALMTALKPVAAKFGIEVLTADITRSTLSEATRKQVLEAMLLADTAARQGAQAKTQAAASKKLSAMRAQIVSLLATSRQQAATIEGEGEAQVAAIYARAAKPAPDFFRFYQTLLGEQAALETNTRLFIISTDSSWFRLLGTAPGKGGKP